jgi:pyruvate formate lyase activating enzyme
LSGGEPLLQWAFCRELLQALRSQDLHTAVETAGYVPYRNLAAVLPFVNLFLFDFKIADSARHEAYTGHPNVLIKANLEQLLHDGANVIVRVPLIPGVNDDAELDRISEYLRGKPVQAVEILPYHEYGRSKYASLGIEYRLPVTVAPDRQCLSAAEDLFRRNGINARAYP